MLSPGDERADGAVRRHKHHGSTFVARTTDVGANVRLVGIDDSDFSG